MEVRGPFRNLRNIILASSSPRRQRLLASLGIYFDVIPSRVKEKTFAPDMNFEKLALENAINKAEDVKKRAYNRGVIIAADTIVVLDNKVLGKPKDEKDGVDILRFLTGKTHEVITGCCFLDLEKDVKETFCVKSKVKIALFDEKILKSYVNTKEGLDKAGCYAVQGVGAFLVESIEGSYTNVVGLPLKETVDVLLKMGAITVEE